MENEDVQSNDATKAELLGAAVTLGLGLIPYMAISIIFPTILGVAFSAWFYHFKLGNSLKGQGAKLGFYTSVTGNLVSVLVYDVFWVFLNYQIGAEQINNIATDFGEWIGGLNGRAMVEQSMLSQAQSSFSISALVYQVITGLVLCGVFGAGTGALYEFFAQEKILVEN